MIRIARLAGACAAATLCAAVGASAATADPLAGHDRSARLLAPTTVASNLQIPWGAATLPDGSTLITERNTARIRSISPTGQVRTVQTITEARARGEGGLLGIAISPTFATDNLVYIYFTTNNDNRIARMRLGQRPQTILTGIPAANIHNGGRIAFGPDGMLYAGTGDANNMGNAQNRNSLGGKILRMTPTGQPAPGNPFPNSVVWSLGHRNVQGLAWDASRRMYAAEFGQNRFDELNRIRPGSNYGWPTVEGRGNDPRFVNPLVVWTTAEASPSGISIRGRDVFVACLRGQKVFRVGLNANGGVAGQPQALFNGQFGRLRHVLATPGGALLALTSNRDGRGTPRQGDDKVINLGI